LENLNFQLDRSIATKGQLIIVPWNLTDTDHIALRYSEVHGHINGGGMQLFTSTGQLPHSNNYIVIYKNYIHDNGDVNASFDQDNHGINIANYAYNIWILDNEFTRNSGNGIQINGGYFGNTKVRWVYVGRNVAHGDKQSGFWTKQASDVIFSQNESYDNRVGNSSSGGCIGTQYRPHNLWYIFNKLHDCDNGIRTSTDKDSDGTAQYFIGNLIYNIHFSGFNPNDNYSYGSAFNNTNDSPVTRYIIGNTINNIDAGIISWETAGKFVIRNNIFNGLSGLGGKHIAFSNISVGNASDMSYNLFDNPARIDWGDHAIRNLTAFQAAFPGEGTGSLEGNALFVDPASYNLRLQALSPAINAALNDQVFDTFYTLYGIDIKKDFDGVPRPQGQKYSLGAYEFRTISSTLPNPPTNLRIN
jgi:hypothetical protein